MTGRENVVGGGCPVSEVSLGEVSHWELSFEKVSVGELSRTNLSMKLFRKTALKTSKKEQWPIPFVENPVESLSL